MCAIYLLIRTLIAFCFSVLLISCSCGPVPKCSALLCGSNGEIHNVSDMLPNTCFKVINKIIVLDRLLGNRADHHFLEYSLKVRICVKCIRM